MALRSGFFNSINGDRTYHTGHWAEYFASFIGNGVFPNPSNNLQVASNNNMTITIKPGKAWINGYILINDSDYQLSLTPADGVLNRIDRIVARYDTVARAITLEVKQGAFASNPVAPTLQRDADGYELAIADIRINAGVISITQANITDTRLNSDLCGIVHGVVEQVDTTTLFNQYQSWIEQEKLRFENDVDDWLANEQLDFETWEQQQKDDFDMWFSNIQDILDGNVAANLQSQIEQIQTDLGNIDAPSTQEFESLQSDFSAHQEDGTAHGIGDRANLETNEKGTIVEAVNELFTNVSDGKDLVGGAITGVDDSVVIPTDPSFGDLASAIGGISTGKKWASGQVTSSSVTVNFEGVDSPGSGATAYKVEATGLNLEFTPSIVVFSGENSWLSNDRFDMTIYFKREGVKDIALYSVWYGGMRQVSGVGFAINNTSFSGIMNSQSFVIPVSKSSTVYNWIAYE